MSLRNAINSTQDEQLKSALREIEEELERLTNKVRSLELKVANLERRP